MTTPTAPLAVVTGSSSGLGLHLALCCARAGYDLVLAADTSLDAVQAACAAHGVQVRILQVELAGREGVDELCELVGGRPVGALLANAGHGPGQAFFDQQFAEVQHVVDTHITGTLYLLQRLGRRMRDAGSGRILITGSIAGLEPGSVQAVYNASKAFVDAFAGALRNELQDAGVTVSWMMPGVTDSAFFERAGLLDSPLGTGPRMDPADVAEAGFSAMQNGEADVVAGLRSRLQHMLAEATPSPLAAGPPGQLAGSGAAQP